MELSEIRTKIDAVDDQLLSLFNARDHRVNALVDLVPSDLVDMHHLRQHENAAEDGDERQHREVREACGMQGAMAAKERLNDVLAPADAFLQDALHRPSLQAFAITMPVLCPFRLTSPSPSVIVTDTAKISFRT